MPRLGADDQGEVRADRPKARGVCAPGHGRADEMPVPTTDDAPPPCARLPAHGEMFVWREREPSRGRRMHVRPDLDGVDPFPVAPHRVPDEVAAGLGPRVAPLDPGLVQSRCEMRRQEEGQGHGASKATGSDGQTSLACGSRISGQEAAPRPTCWEAPPMSDLAPSTGPGPETVFKFTAEGVDLEFAGTEAFVERQVKRFRSFLQGAVGLDESAAPEEAAEAESAEIPDFAAFVANRPPREGRGAIQDRILLSIYYMNVVRKQRELGADDILFCFRQADWEEPKNLHNALGILKRKIGHLQEGSRRGLYQLSPLGLQYMEGRYRGI